jgi:hypothetical protein
VHGVREPMQRHAHMHTCFPCAARLTAACPLLHMHAATSPHAMPPLARRDVRNLVRKLGASARPSQQVEAAKMIMGLADDEAAIAAIASAGAIPSLVQLLGPGSSAEVR